MLYNQQLTIILYYILIISFTNYYINYTMRCSARTKKCKNIYYPIYYYSIPASSNNNHKNSKSKTSHKTNNKK